MSKHRFPQKGHLKKSDDFSLSFKTAKKLSSPYFVIYISPKQNSERSFAFIATKKIGNAVQRNTVKRKLRELARKSQHHINKRYDIILMAKPDLKHPVSPETLKESLLTLLKEHELWLD